MSVGWRNFQHMVWLRYSVLLVLVAIGSVRGAGAQSDLELLDDSMNQLLIECNGNAALLKAKYAEHRLADEGKNRCDYDQMQFFLWMQVKLLDPTWQEPFPSGMDECTELTPQVHYNMGIWHHMQGELGEMRQHLTKCKESAFTPHESYIALQGLGVYHQLNGDVDSAYQAYAASFDAAQDEVDAMGLNNLANAALMAERWEAAVQWSERAEDFYYNDQRAGRPANMYGEGFVNQVLSNRLLAEMKLGHREAANTTFERMRFEPMTGYNAVMMGATAVAYLLWQDDRERFKALQPLMQSWVSEDSTLAVEVMAAHALLFAPWDSIWQRTSGMDAAETWAFVQDCPLALRDVATPEGTQAAEVEGVAWAGWAAKSAWLMAAGLAAWGWRRKRALVGMEVGDLVQTLERALHSDAPLPLTRHMLRQLHLRAPLPDRAQALDNDLPLTPREKDILTDWLDGVRPKETAIHRGISVSAVYNVRATVKRKLELPDGADMAQWFTQRYGSNNSGKP